MYPTIEIVIVLKSLPIKVVSIFLIILTSLSNLILINLRVNDNALNNGPVYNKN